MATPRIEVLTLELTNRQNSTYMREGTERSPNPEFLDAPGNYFLKNISVEKQPDNSYKKLRYIAGCDTPYADEQDKMGVKPNPAQDQIIFKKGVLFVPRSGRTVGLYEFLQKCEFNQNNKNRPEHAEPIFREIREQEQAREVLNDIYVKKEALDMVFALGSKVGNEYNWDTAKIDSLCLLFALPPIESYDKKVETLMQIADAKPQLFLATIANRNKSVLIDIADAQKHNVLSLAGGSASLTATNTKILNFKSKDKNSQTEELADYLNSQKGTTDYKTLRMQLEMAKENAAAVV